MTEVSPSALTQLLQLSPNLEIFAACKLPWHCSLPSDVNHWNRLRFVIIMAYRDHFHSIPVDHPGGFPKTFLQNAANSLFLLCDAFPRLEQLKIGPDLPHLSPEPVGVSPKRWERLWPHLKVLKFDTSYFGDEINYRPLDSPEVDRLAEMTRSTLRYLTCLNRGNSLEHIQFNFPHRNGRCFSSDDHDLLPDFDVTEHSEYRNLKSFNLRMVCMPPDRVRTLLCNAIETNKLTSFDIVFPQGPPTAGERVGDESIRHLQGYEWFRGTPTIHTLGCYDFRFRPDAENDEDLPLPQFLASFPNLRTLCIDSKNYYRPELASVLVAIIKCTHLKTIYTKCYADRMLDRQLRQVARDHGVELIPVIEDWPEEWPIRS
ncbi:hypothetical protein E4U11_008191 [Claviceps purpurea]|nr:hypothetical protein E4U11_008191 [Claviceps purpurea]